MPFIPVLAKRAKKKIKYLLRATFDADNQGYADDQVLDTVAEGVWDGQLTVVEDDGTLAIVSNKCAFTAQVSPTWGHLGLYSQAITRALGRGLLGIVRTDLADKDFMPLLWNDTAEIYGTAGDALIYVLYFYGDATVRVRVYDEDSVALEYNSLGSYSVSTDYRLTIVLGGYHSNGAPWRSGQAAASYLYGAAFFIEGGAFADNTLIWRTAEISTATLYAAASSKDGVGTFDNFRVPDVDLSAVLQPNNLSLFTSAGELSAYTPELGGAWTEDIGDWDATGGVLQATTLGIATFTGLADCLYDAKITMPGSGTTAGGLVLRETDLTGASEDYWYVKITPGTAGTDWQLIEYAAGAATQRASGDVDWTAATAYAIRAICDGQDIACFADGADKISYASAASGETATSFGLRDEGNANMAFDNVALFARTSSVYDAILDSV